MMTTTKHILACIDGSAVTESICNYAAWYASRLDMPVGLLHLTDVPVSSRRDLSGVIGMDSRQSLLEELTQLDEHRSKIADSYSKALIQDAKSYINSHYNVKVNAYQRHGKLLPAIKHFKAENHAIIIGRRGEDHKNSQINIGSHIETVARTSDVPILICSEAFVIPRSYMIAFDASKTALKAIDIVANSPLLKDMQGHIVMIGNHNDTARQGLAEADDKLTSAGFMVEAHHLTLFDTVSGLLSFKEANDVDLIVVGAYGHSKWQQLLLGSVTTEIIASTRAPILLVR